MEPRRDRARRALVVPSHSRVLCVARSAEARIPEPRLRELVPARCTAGGKALLAGRDRWRASLLSKPLRAYTDRTVTGARAVEREAAATRKSGYAIERGEHRAGIRAVAAPVRDRAGTTIAAIGVGTANGLDVGAISARVTRAAAALTLVLGAPAGSDEGSGDTVNAQSCRRIAALQSPTREHEGECAAIRAFR